MAVITSPNFESFDSQPSQKIQASTERKMSQAKTFKNHITKKKKKETVGSRLCSPPSVVLQSLTVKQAGGRHWISSPLHTE